jgi:hypothetical protein
MEGVDAAACVIVMTIEVVFTAVLLLCVPGEQAVQRNPVKTPNNRNPLMICFMPGKDLPGPQGRFLFEIQSH